MTPCFGKPENVDSLQSKDWQHMPQKRNRVWLKSLGYFNISYSRQGHQIILDAVMCWRCKRALNLKVLMVVIFTLFSKRWGLFQLSSNMVKNYLFHSWNTYRGNCLRPLIFYTANVARWDVPAFLIARKTLNLIISWSSGMISMNPSSVTVYLLLCRQMVNYYWRTLSCLNHWPYLQSSLIWVRCRNSMSCWPIMVQVSV